MMRVRGLAIFFCAALAGCGGILGGGSKAPSNVGELKLELREYYDSGRYAVEFAAAIAEARKQLGRKSPRPGQRFAVVLDIDETALSNWAALQANDFGFVTAGPCVLPQGPCGWEAWLARAEAPAMGPTLELFREAKAAGFGVFFISTRTERFRAATERNLMAAGYAGWAGVVLRSDDAPLGPAAAHKGPARCRIEALGWTVILNVGDQPSDLAGSCAERSVLVPNPFYRVP